MRQLKTLRLPEIILFYPLLLRAIAALTQPEK